MQIQTALAKIVESKNLSREESAQVFNLIMTGETTDAQIGAFLAAMRVKGRQQKNWQVLQKPCEICPLKSLSLQPRN